MCCVGYTEQRLVERGLADLVVARAGDYLLASRLQAHDFERKFAVLDHSDYENITGTRCQGEKAVGCLAIRHNIDPHPLKASGRCARK
jgi:hypothetical protein